MYSFLADYSDIQNLTGTATARNELNQTRTLLKSGFISLAWRLDKNEEVINSTRYRIYSLKVSHLLLYFIDGRVFQDIYFLYRIRRNVSELI